jgi:hypothetical protein
MAEGRFSGAEVVQFGFRVGPDKTEIPSTSLRAGSSLRLKNGSAQDDNRRLIGKLRHYRRTVVEIGLRAGPDKTEIPRPAGENAGLRDDGVRKKCELRGIGEKA